MSFALAKPRLGAGIAAFLALGMIVATGIVPAGLNAMAASLTVAQSFGARNASGSASLSALPGAPTGARDLLVATIRDRNLTALAPVSNVTDGAGNTWSRAAGISSGQADGEIWYTANALSLSTAQAVTVTVGGSSAATSAIAFTVLDVTGAATASPLDVTATNSGSTSAPSTGTTATTTQAADIAVADIGWNSTQTLSGQTAGYNTTATQQSSVSGSAAGEQAAWQTLSATGAQGYAATLSGSVAWTGAIATFKAGSAPQPTISAFTPASGPVGTPVVITGTGFTGATAVAFNGTSQPTFSVKSNTEIDTTVPAGAATGLITITAPGGTADTSLLSPSSFTVTSPPPAPTITNFSPAGGPLAASVTISGTGFTGATAVAFNGTSQPTFTVKGDIEIDTTVPCGASTGLIKVTAPGGTADTSALTPSNFSVSPTSPSITGFTPTSGAVGTAVTIAGSGFTCAGAVAFNSTNQPTFTVNSDTQISTTVPTGATTGLITVTTPGGPVNSSGLTPSNFTVTGAAAPTIAGFSPATGPVAIEVIITGTHFTGATAVAFNGTNQPTFTVKSDAEIDANVPAGATSGVITVTGPGGTANTSSLNPSSFTVTPPHVLIVLEENREYNKIIGSSKAPYINSLASTYASATNWYSIQHTSQNDYLELVSGSNQGYPNGKPYSATTLVDELHSAGIPSQSYMEGMTSACSPTATSDGLYTGAHNPYHFFTNYTTSSGGWCSSANVASEGIVPYPGSAGLLTALGGANAPDFVWISPNECDNMHGGGSPCANSNTDQLTTAGDTWLQNNIGPVLSSEWFAQNGIVIITWDEGTTGQGCCGLPTPGGHIASVVITSQNLGLGSFTATGDLYGTLAAIEKQYGIPLMGGSANSVNGDLTGAFAATRGSISGTVTDSVTHAAISGATVSYSGGSTTTDSNGVYWLINVAPGTYTVTASASAHSPLALSVTASLGVTVTQTFALGP